MQGFMNFIDLHWNEWSQINPPLKELYKQLRKDHNYCSQFHFGIVSVSLMKATHFLLKY